MSTDAVHEWLTAMAKSGPTSHDQQMAAKMLRRPPVATTRTATPPYESQPVKVTLTVEVDGHVLKFEETGNATGTRYHGADLRDTSYSTSDTLESGIRNTVEECVTEVGDRAEQFLARAYPVVDGAVLSR